MSVGAPLCTSAGGGGTTNSTGSTNITVTGGSGWLPGDLITLYAYVEGDVTAASDAGDGWMILDDGYDSTNTYGMLIACAINKFEGVGSWSGLTLPASVAWTAKTMAHRTISGYRFDLVGGCGSVGWFNDSTSGRPITIPQILQPYTQVADLAGIGYNNAGTTTTVAAMSTFLERADTGQTSPPHGIAGEFRSSAINGFQSNPAITNSTAVAVAKTKRACVRCMVPIVATGNIFSQYYGSYRRMR